MQASRACPGCCTEWPRQDGETDGDDDVNEHQEDQAPLVNRSSRKRCKRVKVELVEENDNVGPTSRSKKAEAVRAAQEASSAGASQVSKRRKK
jgi:hypothetical protein